MISSDPVLHHETGNPIIVACPGCRQPRALRLAILTPEEHDHLRATHNLVDLTVALAPPEKRRALMNAPKEVTRFAVPWVSCTTCGHDDLYVIQAPKGAPSA